MKKSILIVTSLLLIRIKIFPYGIGAGLNNHMSYGLEIRSEKMPYDAGFYELKDQVF